MQRLKKIDLIYILPQDTLGACVLPKQGSKQTNKPKKDMKTNVPRTSTSTEVLSVTGREDHEMTGEQLTRRDPEEAFQKHHVNRILNVFEYSETKFL